MRWITCLMFVSLLAVAVTAQPSFDFTATPTTGNAPLQVQFEGIGTTQPLSWKWDFGDGTTGVGKSPTHVYTNLGTYSVKLTVNTGLGVQVVLKEDYVMAGPQTVFPAFTWSPETGANPLVVSFTDTSTGDAPDAWHWDFGDGGESTEQNPTHVYNAPGDYSVALRVMFEDQVATVVEPNAITVLPATFQADFTSAPTSGPAPLLVQFTDVSTGTPADTWLWDFGDGEMSTAQNPSHVYQSIDVFDVTLTTNVGVEQSTVTKEAFIATEPAVIHVDFTATATSAVAPVTVQFENLTSGADFTEWTWYFGNGGISHEENPTATFVAGEYTVTLVVETVAQKEFVTKQSIVVSSDRPACAEVEKIVDQSSAYPDFFGGRFAVSESRLAALRMSSLDAVVIDLATSDVVSVLTPPGSGPILDAVLAMHDDCVVIGTPRRDRVSLFDAATGEFIVSLRATMPVDPGTFGTAVAIDGVHVLVGAPRFGSSAANVAYLFNVENPDEPYLASLLEVDEMASSLGTDVALSETRAAVLGTIGPPGAAMEMVAVFDISDPASPTLVSEFAPPDAVFSMAVSEQYVVLGSSDSVTIHDASTGALIAELTPVSEGKSPGFGASVALDGSRLLVGAPNGTNNLVTSGTAYLYDVHTGTRLAKFAPSSGQLNDGFGSDVAVVGDRLYVGAPGDDELAEVSGAVYRFEPVAMDWTPIASAPNERTLRGFGVPVSGCGVTLELTEAPADAASFLVIGSDTLLQPLQGGVLVPTPEVIVPLNVDSDGLALLRGQIPPGVPLGTTFVFQHWAFDPSSPSGVVPSNGLVGTSSD